MNKRVWILRAFLGAIMFAGLALIIIFVLIPLFRTGTEGANDATRVYGYTEGEKAYTLENDRLLFTLDPVTTHFTVTQKDNGHVWYSNPPLADSDPIALPADKTNLKSTLSIVYSTINGVNTLLNNYTYSIEKGIYEIEPGDGFIKVKYSLGKVNKTFVIPIAITESRMNTFLAKMEKSESKQTKEYYRKYDIGKLRATDNKEELLKNYPDLATEPLYILRDGTADYLKKRVEGYLEKAGYTYEDYAYDMSRTSASSTTDNPVFNVTLLYRLEGGDLVVEVPYEEIGYKSSYPITKLTLLPNFGAGGTSDDGFMLVPEGGGGLIRFNNGKLTQNTYYSNIYGWDYATMRKTVVNETRSAFPVFGVSMNDSAFLCILEDGAGSAGVAADISGRYNSYNTVNAIYTLLHSDSFDVTNKSNQPVLMYEKSLPQGFIRQRYRFMDTFGYTAMATAYREYLLEKYPSLARKEDTSTPVLIEIVGAVDKLLQRVGLPTSVPFKLTTHQEAREMLTALSDAGFKNLSVKYAGFLNGGIRQKVLTTATLLPDLGSEADLKSLTAYCAQNGMNLYLDGVTQFAYDSGPLDGFMAFRDAAKFTTREEVELREYSPIWYGTDPLEAPYYLVKPVLTLDYTRTLAKAADKYGTQGVSFRDTGFLLSSDFNPKEPVTRDGNIAFAQSALKEVKAGGQKTLINAGNEYAVAYADLVSNMDLEGAPYSILDAYVPFYQMALHGYVCYTGESLNMAGDFEQELLKSAETGAGLSFTFIKAEASMLSDTLYTEYYGASFSQWYQRAKDIYQRYDAELGGLFDQTIVGHERLDNQVTITTYQDGTKVYVNFGRQQAIVDGIVLAPRSYQAKGVK